MAQLAGRLDALPDGLRLVLQLHAAARVRHQGGGLPAVGLAAGQLSDRASRRSPPCSPACSPRSACTRSSGPRRCCSPADPACDILLVLALLTMLVGILGAVAAVRHQTAAVVHPGQPHRLHAVRDRAGHRRRRSSGAIFYVVHHITIQTTLFLVAGLIERRGGTTTLDRLGGLARLAPLLGVLFFVPAMNLAGIPPFSGFLGKLGLLAGRAPPTAASLRLAAGRRRRGDQPADPVRGRPGLEPGLLAHAAECRHRRRAAPLDGRGAATV